MKQEVVYCGVVDSNDKPVKLTKQEQEDFVNMCSDGGKYKAIFCNDYTDMIKSIIKDDNEK